MLEKLRSIGQLYQLSMLKVAQSYSGVQRYRGNPYYPTDVVDKYGPHTVRIGKEIEEFDIDRRAALTKNNSKVLEHFNRDNAKQLALIKFATISFGELYILPSQIEIHEDKYAFYQKLKRKITNFAFTLALVEVMSEEIGQRRPIFSALAEEMQKKALTMTYEEFVGYLTDFFKQYPEPYDYIQGYMKKTGDSNLLKMVNLDYVKEIVDQELISRYIQIEEYSTPEASFVNLLDAIISDDEMLLKAMEGIHHGHVQKSIYNVRANRDEQELVESFGKNLDDKHSRIPSECLEDTLFNGTVNSLKIETLQRYIDETGVDIPLNKMGVVQV